jgi:chromosome segregation ATPase
LVSRPQPREQPGGSEVGSQWVEDQLQEATARIHKLENELEQALKHIWSVDADIRTLTEAVSSSGAASVAVDKLREDLRQLSERLSRIQDRQTELGDRVDKGQRERRSETGRDRQELGVLAKQLEAVERGVAKYEARIQATEEALRHAEEEISSVRLAGEGIERSVKEMMTRVERGDEGANRISEDVARLASHLDRLEKQDAQSKEQARLTGEQVKRLAEQLDQLEELKDFPKEVRDLLARAAHEREQISQRVNIADKLSTEASDLARALQQAVALMEQRSHNQGAQLTELAKQLQELEEQTVSELRKLMKVTLRQRRRQLEALSQEIKELTQGEPKSED